MQLAHHLSGNVDGPLLLFLHGFLGDAKEWRDITPAFEPRYRCLTVDSPGHGASQITRPAECGFVETATALIELVDEAGADTFSAIGYSMGGRIALYLASIYAMRMDALVLESASPGLPSEDERAARREWDDAIAHKLETMDMPAFLDEWYAQPLFATLQRDPEKLAELKARRAHRDGRQLAAAMRALGTGAQPSLWTEWQANHIPTLLIAGALDEKYVAIAQTMGERCAAAEIAIVPDCGHNVHFENPSVYTDRVLAFLDQNQE
ncbi:MAG: putative hydrolase, alpha/beta fold protein [Candidatus Hydrogenedentota bacterium]